MLPHVACIILAGGEARRAGGRNKSFRLVEGRPIIAHQLERLRTRVGDPITVVTDRPKDYRDYDVRCIPDLELPECPPDRSPMRGLLSALRDSPEPWVLVVACDAPWPEPEPLRALYAKCSTPLATTGEPPSGLCFKDAHGIQPMPGFYRKELADDLENLLTSNQRGLRRWIEVTPGMAALDAAELGLPAESIERVVCGFNAWDEAPM